MLFPVLHIRNQPCYTHTHILYKGFVCAFYAVCAGVTECHPEDVDPVTIKESHCVVVLPDDDVLSVSAPAGATETLFVPELVSMAMIFHCLPTVEAEAAGRVMTTL